MASNIRFFGHSCESFAFVLDYSIHFVIQSVMLENAHCILQVSKRLCCPLHSVTPMMVRDSTCIGCHAKDIKRLLLHNQVFFCIYIKLLYWLLKCFLGLIIMLSIINASLTMALCLTTSLLTLHLYCRWTSSHT